MRMVLNNHSQVYLGTSETHYFADLRPRLSAHARAGLTEPERKTCEQYLLKIAKEMYGLQGLPPITPEELSERAETLGTGADAYFEAYCLLVAERKNKMRWGEKTPRHIYRIPEIMQAFPQAQVIAMVRDPRAVAASRGNWQAKNISDQMEDALRQEYEKGLRIHEQTYHLLLACFAWKSEIGAVLSAQKQFGNAAVYTQRFEDLVQQPEEAVSALCEWLGMEFEPAMLEVHNFHKKSSFGGEKQAGIQASASERWKQTLKEPEIALIQKQCGAMMTALDYEPASAHASIAFELSSWGTLPLGMARNFWAYRHKTGKVLKQVLRRLKLMSSKTK